MAPLQRYVLDVLGLAWWSPPLATRFGCPSLGFGHPSLCVGLQIPDLEVQISELDDHILMWMSMFWIWKSIARDLDIQIQDVDALQLDVQMRDLAVTSGFGCPNPRCICKHPGFRNQNAQFQRKYVSGRPNPRKHFENPNLCGT